MPGFFIAYDASLHQFSQLALQIFTNGQVAFLLTADIGSGDLRGSRARIASMRDLTKRELKIRNLSEALQRSDGVIPDRLLPVGCNQTEGQFAERAAKRGFLIWRHGWPDFLVRSKGAMYAVEVKKGNDRISTAQRAMFSALEAAGIKVFVWDPANPDKLVPWRRRARKVKGRA